MSSRVNLLLAAALALSGCRQTPPDFAAFTSEFVYAMLSLSPTLATGSGYHKHQGVILDERLDDFSPEGLERQHKLLTSFRERLAGFPENKLDLESRADRSIMQDQIDLYLLELDTIQSYKHNPTLYVEMIGNALFTPLVLEYAGKDQRIGHIIKRLEGVPAVITAARRNLVDSPEVWNRVAREENEGNISLIEGAIRQQVPQALKESYEKAAAPALSALREFNEWLEKDLSQRTSDWRLGENKYAPKLKAALGSDMSPAQLLADAEAELDRVRAEMAKLAGKAGVAAALRRISGRRSTVDAYFSDAQRDLEEARRFVSEKKLLALPARDNLKLIETPEFMRGIYGVGGFNPAPPLQPELGAFYWLTPIPKTWPKERIESKLREYNYYALKLLTIHEAMPGHYVQLEYANGVRPAPRRVLRGVFGSGPYIEGWAVYATEAMLDAGYLNGSADLRLTFLKQQLRMIANAILDVRMQTMGMTDEEAMRLMVEQTYQEKEEATAKLQRAKLSSTQLPTYFVGYREWKRLREQRQDMPLAEFHERALQQGAVPMRVLGELLPPVETH